MVSPPNHKTTFFPIIATILVAILFIFSPIKPKPFGDGEYHEGAKMLINFILNGFTGPIRVDKGLITIIYYAIPYCIVFPFGSETLYLYSGIIFNVIIVTLGTTYLIKIFQLIKLSDSSIYMTCFLLLVFPIHIYYSMGILAEPPTFFLVILMMYFWLAILNKHDNQMKHAILLGVCTSLIIGIRPNIIPFAIVFLTFLCFKVKSKRTYILILAPAVFITIISLLIERKVNTVSSEFKSTVFRNQILWSRYELRDEPFNWIPQHSNNQFASSDYLNNIKKRNELDSICEQNNLNKTFFFIKWVAKDIWLHPMITLRQYFLKFFQSQSFIITPLIHSNKSPIVKYGVHLFINFINYLILALAIAGLFYLRKNKRFELLIPIVLFWGWLLVYICIFHSEQRYMFPSRPLLVILAGISISYLTTIQNRKNKSS